VQHHRSKLGLPTSTIRRALEDLTAHGLVIRRKVTITTDIGDAKEGRDDVWSLAAVSLHGAGCLQL
jgi:predicted transcriptional regulator